MKIVEIKLLRGPNYWSTYRKNLVVMKLDLEDWEQLPTDKIEGFAGRIKKMLPSLYEHRCSEGQPGGLFERIKRGTWLGHVIEHVALEIQSLAGMPCGYGRTRSTSKKGTYHVVFTYQVENAGRYAAEAAVRIVAALKNGEPYDVENDIRVLAGINRREGLGPTTQAIVNAAKRRDIPYRRLDDDSLILLGQGVHQKLLRASMVCNTSSIGVDLACDKVATKKILAQAYIPVPAGYSIYSKEELADTIQRLGFPLVLKPWNGNHGKGITTNINTEEEAFQALEKAQQVSTKVIAERFIKGMDYRFLVINFKLEAVARRTPAMVIGDDLLSIAELIEKTNQDPARGEGHEKVLTKIKVDAQLNKLLAAKNLALDSILPHGEILFLTDTANLSTGGSARDVTDLVHPQNIFLAERIARLMNLDICGIDIVAEDITRPITTKTGAVLEVNASPDFRMHLSPSKGTPRDVGEPVIEMLYPPGKSCRIPIVAVTGTNGKTTTTRLVAHLAKEAGHNVGYTTTDGIYIQGQSVHSGDCSGPASAQVVLRDPLVDFAVLETARGGILRSGLGFDKCNISIITNITGDHLGLEDINTIEELARLKAVVARSTFDHGFSILNADDDIVYGLRRELDCNIALFSTTDNNERVIEHCEAGGWAALIEKGYFTICKGEWRTRVAKVVDVPLTLAGRAIAMTKNILPSILAASLSDIDIKLIRKALQSFLPGPAFTPGRMNIFKIGQFEVMLDYVHNTDGFKMLQDFMDKVNATRKICILGCPGDRREEDIREVGKYAATIFDEIIIRHDKDGRGRTNEAITALLQEGINSADSGKPVLVISNELEATAYAMDKATKGSFIVLCSEDTKGATDLITGYKKKAEELMEQYL